MIAGFIIGAMTVMLLACFLYIKELKKGPAKRARAIPKGTEGARRGRKPKGDPKPEKPPIPPPGEPLPMD